MLGKIIVAKDEYTRSQVLFLDHAPYGGENSLLNLE